MIAYKEIEQTPHQAAVGMYRFVCADLEEGLNYGVSAEAYNGAMAGIGSARRTDRTVSAREFVTDFYTEYQSHAQAQSCS